ncbi:phosphoserine aminotransferase [Lentinula edodes]|uniref:phosphoserine transaminase n=1 Tax=Lentinula edodes TaxID=5353 RepID=A0A1Q3E513_LENED|nr:phosphoserine aminotransferase [Lentinula edodes]
MHAIVPSSSNSFIHPTYWPQASNSALNDAPPLRLKSPFQLASSSTVETTSENFSSRAPQRRRHCVRVDCPVQSVLSSSSSHPFDDLSWISAMDSSSEDYGLSDIADLSELPIPTSVVEEAGPEARPVNFGAGPSALPESVLEEACKGLFNFKGTGIGIAEISHRSKEFTSLVADLENNIRTQLGVPPTHKIIFTQGGGTGQFSAVVLNLLARHRLLHPDLSDEQRVLDYVITGSWSKKAMEEAKRLGGGSVHIAVDARAKSEDSKSYDNIPAHEDFDFSADPALIYYCGLWPLVADYSSSFMSRKIPRIADHAVIFAGAQKNIGPAGLTILIVRQDCIVDVDAAAKLGAVPVPITMSYKTNADAGSLYNTPSTLSIYIAGLVLERSKKLGGVEYFESVNGRKAQKVYTALQEGEEKGVYRSKVKEGSGSWMNVVFDVLGDNAESKFLAGAEALGMKALKGHRSVGGIRISLYNAITEEQTDRIVAYLKDFPTQIS